MPRLMMMRALAVAALALTGCWRNGATSTEPAPDPTCDAVAAHVQELLGPKAHVHDVVRARCTDDRWARDVMACMLAETTTDRRHCRLTLTRPQREALTNELRATRERELPSGCVIYDRVEERLEGCARLSLAERTLVREQHLEVVESRSLQSPDAAEQECRSALAEYDTSILMRCGVR